MNIEEAINKIKEVIYMSDGEKVDYIDINHSDLGGEVSVDIFIKAIETLLTAYEKEKEERETIGKLYYEANENCIKYEKELEKEKEKNKKAKEFIQENSHEFNCKRDDLIELEFDNNTNATDLIDILDGNW